MPLNLNWINVKNYLPLNDTEVYVQIFLLWRIRRRALYLNKYFIMKGENITKWVTHWRPLLK
jgi:hypothetical protein